jgi:dTDP-4-dehydrorhamnose 3,5-epimerase-like enzyme
MTNNQEQLVESYVDERASRYFDIFRGLKGQVTVSRIAARAISGWHKHKFQTDQFFVAKGNLKLSVVSPAGAVEVHTLSGESPMTITVLPDYWHGWRALEEEVILLYYLDRKHDENDEFRRTQEQIKHDFGIEL